MTRKINMLVGLFVFISVNAFAADIVGQKADYQLDKNPQRTSSMIKSGSVTATIANFLENDPSGPAYEVNIDYLFKVTFMGTYQGTEAANLEKEFFTEAFLENLRKTGHYEGANFKADHKGYADAENLDGKFYSHCDKVLLYDLKKPGFFTRLVGEMIGMGRADLKNAKVLAHIYPKIPVLGAVKIDVSGVASGQNVKVGGDYVSPE